VGAKQERHAMLAKALGKTRKEFAAQPVMGADVLLRMHLALRVEVLVRDRLMHLVPGVTGQERRILLLQQREMRKKNDR
jgi:hypothetical protein